MKGLSGVCLTLIEYIVSKRLPLTTQTVTNDEATSCKASLISFLQSLSRSLPHHIAALLRSEFGVAKESVEAYLRKEDIIQRMSDLCVDRLISHPLSPPVILCAESLPSTISSSKNTLAILCGRQALMQHHLYIFACATYEITVVGICSEWLTKAGRAKRVMTYDHTQSVLIEYQCEKPLAFTHAIILEVNGEKYKNGEVEAHQAISSILRKQGVVEVNSMDAVKRASDKLILRQSKAVPTPFCFCVTKIGDIKSALEKVRFHSHTRKAWVVVHPRANTTQADGVYAFGPNDDQNAIQHAQNLLLAGYEVLISEWRGNVLVDGRSPVLRLNVVNGEIVSASANLSSVEGFGIVINGSSLKSSDVSLGYVLSNLKTQDGKVISMSESEWETIKSIALAATKTIGLQVAGVDILLEYQGDDGMNVLTGIVTEVNARPGTLSFGESLHLEHENLKRCSWTSKPSPICISTHVCMTTA